jgi:hypothetical protein
MFLVKCVEKIKKIYFVFNKFLPENRAIYEILSKNEVEPEVINKVTIWQIRVACWTSKTTRTDAQTHADKYVTHAVSPLQKRYAKAPQCYVIVYCLSGYSLNSFSKYTV